MTVQHFDLEIVHQGHRVRLLQCLHLMTNTKIYKSIFDIFVLGLTVSEILTFDI